MPTLYSFFKPAATFTNYQEAEISELEQNRVVVARKKDVIIKTREYHGTIEVQLMSNFFLPLFPLAPPPPSLDFPCDTNEESWTSGDLVKL